MFSPLSLDELLSAALKNPESKYDPKKHLPEAEMIEFFKNKLLDKSELLNEFFGIEISKDLQALICLPIINDVIKPYPEELPMFILRIATDVDYSS